MDTLKDKECLEDLHESGRAPWRRWDADRQVEERAAVAAVG
jgi:hypothetical protein